MQLIDLQVLINSILYVLEKCGGVCDKHKINKIFYFADQMHLSRYSRSITGDDYIAMQYGPVPSKVYDILNAVSGTSFFSSSDDAKELNNYFQAKGRYKIKAVSKVNMDYLSQSDIECLDEAIEICSNKSFDELTNMSHKIAWNNADANNIISIKDILIEAGDTIGYAEYVSEKINIERMLTNGFA